MLKTSRKFHKWLMLFIGAQFVIWSVTGAYMVIFHIDFIHGDSLVKNHQESINKNNIRYQLSDLFKRYPHAENIELGKLIKQDVYRFSQQGDKYMLSAVSGEQLPPLNQAQAITVARYHYSGDHEVAEVELITENPPFELSPRRLPAWRVNFDAFGSPSIYIASQNGKLVGKRHEYWRTFDLFFRLHVMDYETGEDIDNLLLLVVALLGIIACLSGLILAYFRVFKNKSNKNADKNTNIKTNTSTSTSTSSGGL